MYQEPSDSRNTPISGRSLLVPGNDVGVRLGDDVLVLYRQYRDIEADHGARAPREIARGGDDVLCDPVDFVGPHEPFAAGSLFDTRHAVLAMDDRAPGSGAPGQGLGEIRGLDVTVVGVADGADEAIGDRQGPDLADLLRG